MDIIKQKGIELFKKADIIVNGSRPWDIQVHNDKFYSKLLLHGTIALGESYVDGWWGCEQIDQFIYRILKSGIHKKFNTPIIEKFRKIRAILINLQTKFKSSKDVSYHYDFGNDLFENMLDKNMIYSCGYWKKAKNLDQAQIDKLELTCKKLKLKPGMKVLDIGCGFGGFAKYAAEKYKVKVVGITLSKNQLKFAEKFCKNPNVKFLLEDYRNHRGKYDSIVSIGMFEHVGYKNYRKFMKIVDNCLKKDGLFLLHTIAISKTTYKNDPWVEKYIFPGTMVPSVKQIGEAMEGIFYLQDWHNFGPHYHKTILEWHKNFTKNWDKIKHNYDKRFYRMWKFYLLYCSASAIARTHHLWQIVFAKIDSNITYQRVE